MITGAHRHVIVPEIAAPAPLAGLAGYAGAERARPGPGQPSGMGSDNCVAEVRGPGLSGGEELILGGNAGRLLALVANA